MTKHLPSVTIVRNIKASPAKVWAAITQPEQMLQWWGPDAGPTLRADVDVRPGGRFSVVFRLLNGQEHNGRALTVKRGRCALLRKDFGAKVTS